MTAEKKRQPKKDKPPKLTVCRYFGRGARGWVKTPDGRLVWNLAGQGGKGVAANG